MSYRSSQWAGNFTADKGDPNGRNVQTGLAVGLVKHAICADSLYFKILYSTLPEVMNKKLSSWNKWTYKRQSKAHVLCLRLFHWWKYWDWYSVPRHVGWILQAYFGRRGSWRHTVPQRNEGVLNRKFPETWNGSGRPITWPPHSPDFTHLDFVQSTWRMQYTWYYCLTLCRNLVWEHELHFKCILCIHCHCNIQRRGAIIIIIIMSLIDPLLSDVTM
jgi:hypothetical protein